MINSEELITINSLWETIAAHQGETFYTKKMLPFTYTIQGGEMFTDRRERSITRSTFETAYLKMRENPDKITGPKALNMYGAPYVWAVLTRILSFPFPKN